MVHYGTPMPPKHERQIWDDAKNAISKALECSIFNLNWNQLLRDKKSNQKVILFINTLLHILRTFIFNKIIECDYLHPPWMTALALSRLKNVIRMANVNIILILYIPHPMNARCNSKWKT